MVYKREELMVDFVYLFLIVFAIKMVILIISYVSRGERFFDEDSLSYLSFEKIIMYVLIWPIFEEYCFRGIFNLANSTQIILTMVAICTVGLLYFKSNTYALLTLAVLVLSGFVLLFNRSLLGEFNEFMQRNRVIMIVFTSILFSVAHLKNYSTMDIYACIKVLPRLVGGLYLGYIASKYGVRYAIGMHALNNLLPFFLLIYQKYAMPASIKH